MSSGSYLRGAAITGFLAFCIIWIACSVEYGFHGFALGWMPALILGALLGAIWPLVWLLIGVAALGLLWLSARK